MKRTLLFVCTLLCVNVLLAQTSFVVGNLKYDVDSSNPTNVMVRHAGDTITIANIPSIVSYNETSYNVTAIRAGGFCNCTNLISVTIPNSITYIGGASFKFCTSLSSITIPESVIYIGDSVFSDCGNLTTINLSMAAIPDYIFANNTSLQNLTIGGNVTSIGMNAFSDCTNLTSVTFEENSNLQTIGAWAFAQCPRLSSITIPENVNTIEPNVFYNCLGLTSVVSLAETAPIIGENAFQNTPSEKTLTVPCGSLESYNNSEWNNHFENRIEEDCSSNLEDIDETQISFYPNPTNSNITFSNTIEKIEVIDITGRIVNAFTNVREINIGALPLGAYYLKLYYNDKAIMRKIIKE